MKRNVPSLTGLRGAAACWVVCYHMLLGSRTYSPELPAALSNLIFHGYLAVDVFFVLSGFVMALTYGALFSAAGPFVNKLGLFMMRRVARLYPLYLLVLAVTAPLAIRHGFEHDVPFPNMMRELVFNVLMVQNWGIGATMIGSAWSVSVELLAYCLFPASVLLLTTRKTWICQVIFAVCFLQIMFLADSQLANPLHLYKTGPLDVYFDYSLLPALRCVSEFTMGLVAYRIAETRPALLMRPSIGAVVVVLCIGFLMVPNSDVIFVATLPFVMVTLTSERNPVARMFSYKPAIRLGELSYAIYLWHATLLVVMDKIASQARYHLSAPISQTIGGMAMLITLALAVTYSHKWVEVPGRRLVRNWETKWFPQIASPSVAETQVAQAS